MKNEEKKKSGGLYAQCVKKRLSVDLRSLCNFVGLAGFECHHVHKRSVLVVLFPLS